MKPHDLVAIAEQWTITPGSLYGLQQPAYTGTITLRKIPATLIEPLIAAIDAALQFQPPAAEAHSATRLIERFPAWLASIHRTSKLPLSSRFKIFRLKSESADLETFRLTLPIAHPQASTIALKWLATNLNACHDSQRRGRTPPVLKESPGNLHTALQEFAPKGLNLHQMIDAAYRLEIPIRKIASQTYLLGTGACSRWIDSTITDQTPFLGAIIAQNKQETARLLRQAGLPGGENSAVDTADEAVAAARSLGFPVVIKPADQEQGRGVMADLHDEALVRSAYAAARKVSKHILVERHARGFTHRLTVMHGQVIRVTKRVAGGVVGDGQHDIAGLIELQQQDPDYQRRARSMGKQLLSLDDEARSLLKQYGLQPSHILAPGQYLKLRRRDNVNAGASNQSCELASVHPDNLQLAIDAAALLRLDLAGIDLIIEDIGQSWRTVDALICEVNARPQIVAPEDPLFYDGILRGIMGQQFRIPVDLVIVPAAPELRPGLVQKWLRRGPGLALSDASGIWVEGQAATRGFDHGFSAAQAMLMRTTVHEAVCLLTLDDIRSHGFPASQWHSVQVEKMELFTAQEQERLKPTLALLAPGTQVRLRAESTSR